MTKMIALVVTHNRLEKLQTTLSAILSQQIEGVLVVNCGSTDGTETWLNAHTDRRVAAYHTDNLGGAGGFALGVKQALAQWDFDWLLLFDDDAYADADLIEHFLSQPRDDSDLVAAQVQDRQGNWPLMNRVLKIYPKTVAQIFQYVFQRDRFLAEPNQYQSIALGSFVGLFVRRSVLERTQTHLDPHLFVYFDDAHYTLSCTDQGYRYLYDPKLKFTHDIPAVQTIVPWKFYLLARNQFVQKLNYASKTAFYVHTAIRTLSWGVKAVRNTDRRSACLALWRGTQDGYRGDFSVTQSSDPVRAILKRVGQ